jgi:ribonucleoside-diphosphate reductase alpha chain
MTINLTKTAQEILNRRYLQNGETVEDLFRRVSKAVSSVEPPNNIQNWEHKFYDIMANLEFIPNSPTLFNAGKENGTLSGCFYFSIEDDMESILDVNKKIGIVEKHGGGIGVSLSHLRPKGFPIRSTQGIACGPISVMKMIHATNDMITQGGKRAGAMMAILRCDHPDVAEFIVCKDNNNDLNGFNISVSVTDSFMEAIESNLDWNLMWDSKIVKTVKARELFDSIVSHAWKNGDPGIIFIDEINRKNTTPHLGRLEGTNPCGEQPLYPDESCNLGSINLSKFVVDSRVDWDGLKDIVYTAVRFLDNVIDINRFPLPEIKEATERTRKIGLGVMGWADMLIKLGIKYDSDEALQLASDVMSFINFMAEEYSKELAIERGSYPGNNGDKIRNASRTTIAPTGSLSLIAGCNGGIEPLFALATERSNMSGKLEGVKFSDVNELFKSAVDDMDIGEWSNEECLTIRDNRGLDYFRTSPEISPEWHIKMQAEFQKYCNNAVSKTINMPNSLTEEDVKNAYLMAWKYLCKGITIYRDGSRDKQVLGAVKKEVSKINYDESNNHRKRGRKLCGSTTRINGGCGYVYVTVNNDENGPREVFAQLGKAGGCAAAYLEAIGRLASLCLKNNIPIESVVRQLRTISCPNKNRDDGSLILSCPDAIGKVLLMEIGKAEEFKNFDDNDLEKYKTPINSNGICPECSSILLMEEGCAKCTNCGFSRC